MQAIRTYIALGSNLNNPVNQIKTALKCLNDLPAISIIKSSSLYLSPPIGPKDQPNFINAVCLAQTKLEPLALLSELQNIEKNMGKTFVRTWGERVIDLDLLLYEGVRLNSKDLQLPHPEILNRDFVLVPLQEISPNLIIQESKHPIDYHLAKLDIKLKKLDEKG